jgi:signal transduction histidine kinase
MLSHELKNPLMASHMALGNLHRHMGEDDPSLQSADTIRQSLETIDAIIDRCAEIDAYEQGKIKLILSRFTVGELLSAIKVAHSHHNERIFIITRRLDDALSLSSDMHYLKIILNNLLTNALKYSAPDTLVELLLTLQQEGVQSQLVLSVSNTVGVAGAPDALQVYDRFYRSEGAKQLPGTGQGLWLAQSMAHALGSQIQLKIDADRVTFGFTLAIA